MSANKGYPSKDRDLRLGESDVYVTGEPIREKQHGLSVLSHSYVQLIDNDAVEASSTARIINATTHLAKIGDVIRFTSGALSGQEVKVQTVAANTITLSETLASAPATSVTFSISRHKYPSTTATGALSIVTPVVSTFVRNVYSSVNVTTGAYVTLIASTAATYRRLSIFDNSNQTLKIAIGAAAAEVDLLLVFPGGSTDIGVNIPAGSRISIQALSALASTGEIGINLFI